MDDINITNVEFGSGLPKWATEESLARLRNLLERQENINSKDRKKVINLIGRMYDSINKSNTNSKSIIQELRAIKSLTSKNTSSTSKPNDSIKSKDIVDSNKRIENLLKNTNKLLQNISENSSNVISPSKVAKSENSSIVFDSSSIVNAINRSTDKIVQTIRNSNVSVELNANDNNDAPTKTEQQKKFDELRETIEKSSDNQIKAYRSLYSRQMRINNVLTEQTRVGSGRVNRNARISRVMQQTQRNTPSTSMGRQNSGLARTVQTLGRALGMVTRLARFIPVIGQIVTVLSSVVAIVGAAANSIKEFGWTLQQEYRAMLKSGFSFVNEIRDGVQMDGIALRRRINDAGLTYEQGIEIMEKNAVLFNNLGIEGVFGTISELADLQLDTGRSFQDELMLSRDEISKFTSQYLASTLNIVRTERQSASERRDAAQHFIQDARRFSQVTGQGMQVIIDRMNELRATDNYRLAMLSRDGEEAQNLDRAITTMSSFNLPPQLMNVIQEAMLDTRGIGIAAAEGGQEMLNALSNLVGVDIGEEFNELIRAMQTNDISADEFNDRLIGLTERFAIGEINVDRAQAEIIRQGGSDIAKLAASLIAGFQQAGREASSRGTGAEESSDVASSAQLAQSAFQRLASTREAIESRAWDSEEGRNILTAGLDLMSSGADTATSTVGLLGGILRGIFEIGSWLVDLLRSIVTGISDLGTRIIRTLSFLPWIKDEDPEAEARREQEEAERQRLVDNRERTRNLSEYTSGESDNSSALSLLENMGGAFEMNRSGQIKRRVWTNHDNNFDQQLVDIAQRAVTGEEDALSEIDNLLSSDLTTRARTDINNVLRRATNRGDLDLEELQRLLANRSNPTTDLDRSRMESEEEARQEASSPINPTADLDARIARETEEINRTNERRSNNSLPNELNTEQQPSAVQRTTTTINRSQDEAEAREERVRLERESNERRQREIEERNRVNSEQSNTNTEQQSIQQQIVVENRNEELLVALNRLNTNVEEMVRLQRNFNNDLTIEIIRS